MVTLFQGRFILAMVVAQVQERRRLPLHANEQRRRTCPTLTAIPWTEPFKDEDGRERRDTSVFHRENPFLARV